MDVKNPDLASRLRAAVEEAEAERARESEARRRRLEEGAAAREALFGQLESFAGLVGHLAVQRDGDGVVLRYGDRALRFEAHGDGDEVRVRVEGWPGASEHALGRSADLADRWVLTYRRHGREERMPFFDAGLEELMVQGLGMPRPEATPDRPMSARTAAALAAPASEPPLRVVSSSPDAPRVARPNGADGAKDDEPTPPRTKTRRL